MKRWQVIVLVLACLWAISDPAAEAATRRLRSAAVISSTFVSDLLFNLSTFFGNYSANLAALFDNLGTFIASLGL